MIGKGPYENFETTETKGIATNVLSLETERRNWALVEKPESAIQAEYVVADIDEEDIKRNEQYILVDNGNGNVKQQRFVMIQVYNGEPVPVVVTNDKENTISQFSGAEVGKITQVKVIAETLPDFNPGELTALQDLDRDVSLSEDSEYIPESDDTDDDTESNDPNEICDAACANEEIENYNHDTTQGKKVSRRRLQYKKPG